MKRRTGRIADKRGSTLITTILLFGVLSAAMASILRYSITEGRLNHRNKLRTQADNSAEAIVEYGFAQLSYTFDNKTSVGSTTFASGGVGALSIPPASALRPNVKYADTEIFAGTVPNGSLVYIDPTEPDNLFDPLKGKFVRAFEVDFSKWSTSYYNPPNRGYGFNHLFKGGTYPPGTPLLRTYRRDNFQDMSDTEFTTVTSGL